jgi:hypothetical protein
VTKALLRLARISSVPAFAMNNRNVVGLVCQRPRISWPGKFLTRLLAGLLFAAAPAAATPLITEFLASNASINRDEDGDYSDWVEIHNPDATEVSLAGWHLTDAANNKTKWTFPAGVTIPANGYLLVWASNKNRGSSTTPLHTNFALSSGGEYLGLIRPDGVTVVSEFAPTYPPQSNDTSYGISQGTTGAPAQTGYFSTPTPGARNGGPETLVVLGNVTFSRESGLFRNTVQVELSGAGAGQSIRYVLVAPSPDGATVPGPTATSTTYTGPITLTDSTLVKAAVFSGDGALRGPVGTAHFARLADELATFSSQLPIFVMDSHGLGPMIKDDIDRDGWLYVFRDDNGPSTLTSTPELATPMEFKVRGSSSAHFPKKSHNVELKRLTGGDNPQPLLGMPASEDWSFVAPWFYDRTFVRNSFTYQLSSRMGHWAPRTRFAEVFLNADGGSVSSADYHGIVIVTDRILFGEDRIALSPPSPSDTTEPGITGGYIIKIDDQDEDEFAFRTSRGVPSFESTQIVVARPKAANLPETHRTYLRNYFQAMEDAIYADHASGFQTRRYRDYLDVDSWIDLHLLNIFIGNADGVLRSYFFTKAPGGKLVAGPAWDFDRTAGSADPRTENPFVWNHTLGDPWRQEWYGPLFDDPDFRQAWVDRWQSLRRGPFANAQLTRLVDELAAQIGPEAAARDAARWPDNASRYAGGYLGEVEHLKDWLTLRADWLDVQFLAVPSAAFHDGNVILTPAPGSQLAYTTDGSDPRTSSGALGATAELSADPVVLPDTATFRVRSYRPGENPAVPVSPWSSVVTLMDLPGSGRLINVSSRGYTGTGDDVLIAGIVIGGDLSARFLARAIGPALTEYGVNSTVDDPVLRLIAGNGTVIAENSRWSTGTDTNELKDVMSQVGAFPLPEGSRDAAIIAELSPGSYTLVVSGASSTTGIALAEFYEIDGGGRAINLSTRARVRSQAQNPLIGGLAVRGDAPKRLLLRAVGPTLTQFNVTGALADPVLTIHHGEEIIATVDDWEATPELLEATTAAGAFALGEGSRDAAIVMTLPPGNYTAVVTGKNNSQGVALVEFYELP